jgi:hypothetical protein
MKEYVNIGGISAWILALEARSTRPSDSCYIVGVIRAASGFELLCLASPPPNHEIAW